MLNISQAVKEIKENAEVVKDTLSFPIMMVLRSAAAAQKNQQTPPFLLPT